MKTLSFGVLMLLLNCAAFGSFLTSPYLQGLSAGSVYIIVESSTQDTVYADYGLTRSYGATAKTLLVATTTASPVTYVHKIKLTGLSLDTLYYISVRQTGSTTATSSFYSVASPGKSFRFCWEGDSRTNTSVFNTIMGLVATKNARFMFNAGDVAIDSTYANWHSQCFTTANMAVTSKVPTYHTVGNHEGWTKNTRNFTQAPDSPSGIPDYYSFDYGDIHFLVLNTELSYTVGSAQYNFASSDLSSTTRKWKIVVAHKPGYTSGGSGAHTPDQNIVTMTTNIFEPNKVDMVLCGHNHFYQHCKVNNIDHIVIGGGGAPLYTTATGSYVVKSVSSYCYGIFDFTPTSMKLTVYNSSDAVIDSIRWNKPMTAVESTPVAEKKFYLAQNFPNPFNPSTSISYEVPANEHVTLKVFDILGHEVATLVDEVKSSGTYNVELNSSVYHMESGVYFYCLKAGKFSETKKMIILK
jgi:hypothetical protein